MIQEKIIQYDKDMKFIKEWENPLEATRALKLKHSTNIISCCNGYCKSSCGYIWRWKDKEYIIRERPKPEAREVNHIVRKFKKAVEVEIPEHYRGMKKVAEYPNYVLYEDKNGFKTCISYYELGCRTPQLDLRDIKYERDR